MFTPSALLTGFCYVLEMAPYHALAYLIFRDRLRFPLSVCAALVSLILTAKFLTVCYCYNIGRDIRGAELTFAVISMIIYIACVNVELSKIFFLYTLVLDYITVCRGIAIFLSLQFLSEPGTHYTFLSVTESILRLVPLMLTFPFIFSFLNITKERVLGTNAPRLWRVIWLVPAFTSFIVLLFTWNVNIASIAGLLFLITRVGLLILIFAVYHILVCSLESVRLQGEAEERARNQENFIAMQRLQYSTLQKQIEEARQARHDLRQHLNVIQSCLDSGNIDDLRDYLKVYGQKLPQGGLKTFCANYAVDTVVSYYAESAAQAGIAFEAQLGLPRSLPVDEPDICVLLGNLLENALEACRSWPKEYSPPPPLYGYTPGAPRAAPYPSLWTTPAIHLLSRKTEGSCPPSTQAWEQEPSPSAISPCSITGLLILSMKMGCFTRLYF